MTGLHPETVALIEQLRALYWETRGRGETLTLNDYANRMGRSKGRVSQLWKLANLPPLAPGRPAKPRKRRTALRIASPAKIAAARASLEDLRARRAAGAAGKPGPMSRKDLARMNVLELDLRAATATRNRDKVRWLRRKMQMGFTLTVEQREVLAIEERRKADRRYPA